MPDRRRSLGKERTKFTTYEIKRNKGKLSMGIRVWVVSTSMATLSVPHMKAWMSIAGRRKRTPTGYFSLWPLMVQQAWDQPVSRQDHVVIVQDETCLLGSPGPLMQNRLETSDLLRNVYSTLHNDQHVPLQL